MKNLILLMLMLISSFQVFSQKGFDIFGMPEVEDRIEKNVQPQLGIDVEQDWFLDWMPNTNFDRNYTMGVAFHYTKPGMSKSILFAPFNLIERLGNKKNNGDRLTLPETIGIGVTAFTPLVIDSPIPIVGDRPFSNIVFLSTTKTKYNTSLEALIQTSLCYGLIGTNVSNSFQSYVHENIVKGRPTDISWEHQVSRGGHFAFLFSHKVSKSLIHEAFSKNDTVRKNIDVSLGYGLNVGWYTGASVELKVKLGIMSVFSTTTETMDNLLNYGNKNAGYQFFKHKNKSGAINTDSDTTKLNEILEKKISKRWDAYLFGSISPRLTPYNSLILGQPHVKSVYTLNYEDYNPFIVDFEYGIVVSKLTIMNSVPIPVKRFDIILSINHRSSEIKNEEYKRWHHWGRISFRFPMFGDKYKKETN